MELYPRTKENTTPNGKQHLFVHACEEDESLREKVNDIILSFEQGFRYCIWASKVPEDVFSEDGKEKISEMAVFIPIITEKYLSLFTEKHSDIGLSGFFDELQRKGTAVLPVVEKGDLLPQFNRMSGEVHGITLTLKEADRMLEDQLNRFLADDKLEERITQEAFSGKLFLSYRKKDIKVAKKIMKAIHDTDAAGAAAIWFDDFLIAGRNFNEGIMENLKSCDAMALAVTPHVLEKDNYVLEEEYPKAVKYGINVLPVEAVHTDSQKLRAAFDGIKPCTEVDDNEGLEDLLRKAGFHGPGSQSAFGEYLLGMAFFIPINVEKDVERAVQLFKLSAGHDCVEACEQLAKLYWEGIGVKRHLREAINYIIKAYDLLMKEDVTEENLRHIDKLFFKFNGLSHMLEEDGQFDKLREMEQAYLDRINNSSFKEDDELILCRVNVLTDLANFSAEYNLDDGRRKDRQPLGEPPLLYSSNSNSGPSEGDLNRAWQYADWASSILDQYRGEDKDMADFLRVVINDQYADICKYRGELSEAIRWKERSLELIEPLAERTGNLEYMSRSFQVSNNLGLFYREASRDNEELMQKSVSHMDAAVKKAYQLANLSPDYQVHLVTALSNRALVADTTEESKKYALECYDQFLKQTKVDEISAKDAWTLPWNSAEAHNIKLYTHWTDRQPVFEKHYGEIPRRLRNCYKRSETARRIQFLIILVFVMCFILQLTGMVDITDFLKDKLGQYGDWIGFGSLILLYGLTVIWKG